MRATGMIIALAIAALVGFTVGGLRSSRPAPEPAAAREQVGVHGIDEQGLRAAVRATVRDELRATRAESPAREQAAEPEPQPVAEPTREQIAVRRDAEAVISSAIGAGRWREEDRESFAIASRQLSPVERDEVVRPLVIALNTQRVAIDYVGPAF